MEFKVQNYTITNQKKEINIITDCPVNVYVGQVFVSNDTANNEFTVMLVLGDRTIQLKSVFPIVDVNIGTKFRIK